MEVVSEGCGPEGSGQAATLRLRLPLPNHSHISFHSHSLLCPTSTRTVVAVLVVVGAVLHQVELLDGDAADVHGRLGQRALRVLQPVEGHEAEGAAAEGVLALGEVHICGGEAGGRVE